MGSLVISQVVSDIVQRSRHSRMVGGSPPQNEASDSSSRPSGDRSVSSTSSTTRILPTTTPPNHTPNTAAPRSNVTRTSSASTTTTVGASQTALQEPQSAISMMDQRPAQQSTHNFHPGHPHSRGFDQSGFPLSTDPQGLETSSPSSPRLQPTYRSTRSLGGSEATSPSRIKVRDLSHIQSFASEELLTRPRMSRRTGSAFSDSGRQYEISSMPVSDIIEMVAGLLTKITTTNDQQHEHIHRPIPPPEDAGNMSPQTSCVLAFHGKNVPSITILSYLSRIHKYCPTTYEVFLSLLVYFDRMTEMVNRGFIQEMQQQASRTSTAKSPGPNSPMPMNIDSPHRSSYQPPVATPPASGSMEPRDRTDSHSVPPSPALPSGQGDLSQFFVVDSYNIHRLVIAGVTCASKFFSDVFYTNSRYAKVGGLPLVELNHLELQFLLLNDFRLSIPVEELEAYGTMLVEFYAREVVAQQQQSAQQHSHHLSSLHGNDGMYMRDSKSIPRQTSTPP